MLSVRLKELRKENKMTQKEVAEKLGLKNVTIGLYETGVRNPEIKTLVQLADMFKVSVDYLLGFTDFRERPEVILRDTRSYAISKEMHGLPDEAIEKVAEYIKMVKIMYNSDAVNRNWKR